MGGKQTYHAVRCLCIRAPETCKKAGGTISTEDAERVADLIDVLGIFRTVGFPAGARGRCHAEGIAASLMKRELEGIPCSRRRCSMKRGCVSWRARPSALTTAHISSRSPRVRCVDCSWTTRAGEWPSNALERVKTRSTRRRPCPHRSRVDRDVGLAQCSGPARPVGRSTSADRRDALFRRRANCRLVAARECFFASASNLELQS
jgi:hypothetical protein